MRWLLLLAVLMADSGRGEEATPPSVREKLRARIVESLPAPAPARPVADKPEQANPVLVLEPMVVSESRGVRELGKQLAAEKQRQEADSFSPLKGGTIYRSERLEVGGWWTPESGWHFLKLKW
jgi:hypothetical protein